MCFCNPAGAVARSGDPYVERENKRSADHRAGPVVAGGTAFERMLPNRAERFYKTFPVVL